MLEALKEEVVRIAKKAQNTGLCKHKAGNVSCIDRESGLICITPSGVDRDYLTVDQVCVIDRDLHVIEGGKPIRPCSCPREYAEAGTEDE